MDLISIHQNEKPGYVYSKIEIDNGDDFKIGYSKNPTNYPLTSFIASGDTPCFDRYNPFSSEISFFENNYMSEN